MKKKKSDRNMYQCIEDLSSGRKDADEIVENIKKILETTGDFKNVVNDANKNKRGETWLHAAIRVFSFRSSQEKRVVKLLLAKYPKLILQDRSETEYAGQTPLHMGVCKGKIWSVSYMLEYLSNKDQHLKVKLLKGEATGKTFNGNVMMAELPLFIAALTCNKDMFNLLLDHGAELDALNSHGDTVCHALIRYAYFNPDTLEDVLDMCRYIRDGSEPDNREDITGKQLPKYKEPINRKLCRKIWLMENKECLNPLQMATKWGQHEIFRFIMDLESYCYGNTREGLFDVKVYDITEIDTIASMSRTEIIGIDRAQSTPIEKVSEKKTGLDVTVNQRSIIMMLLDLDPRCAYQFVMFPPIQRVIDKKWKIYQRNFTFVGYFHYLFMCFLTWHAVEKSQQINNSVTVVSNHSVTYEHRSPEFVNEIPSDAFVTASGVIASVVGILYIIQDALRVVKGRMPYTVSSFLNPYSNGTSRLMFVLFGLLLIFDFGLSLWEPTYENYLLVIAILLGWFLVIFYLGGVRSFCFFTVLIKRVLIEDMSRFFVILGIELIAFSTAMYMVIQGSDLTSDPGFSNFGRIIFAMAKLMVGLGEIDTIYAVRHPIFAIVIFVAFIILTTLLMINALIAMMSGTCSDFVDDVDGINIRDMQWKLQRLSLILFIESILPQCLMSRCGTDKYVVRFNNVVKRRLLVKRYKLEIWSLPNKIKKHSETFDSSRAFRTAVFNVVSSFTHGQEQSDKKQPVSDVLPESTRSEMTPVNEVFKAMSSFTHGQEQSDQKQPVSDVLPETTRSEMTPVNEVSGSPSDNHRVLDIYYVTDGERERQN